MRISSRIIVAAAASIALAGCGRNNSKTASYPTASGAQPTGTHHVESTQHAQSPVYDTQRGFENALPPPDAVGGGPVPGVDSDVGEPRWRNNPGSYDDGSRVPKADPKGNNNNTSGDKTIPPDDLLKERE